MKNCILSILAIVALSIGTVNAQQAALVPETSPGVAGLHTPQTPLTVEQTAQLVNLVCTFIKVPNDARLSIVAYTINPDGTSKLEVVLVPKTEEQK